MMKKLFKVALTLVLAFSLAACSSPKTTGYKAGTYTAEATGMNGPVKVEVTVTTDAIEKVVVTEHSETPSISDLAISDMPVRIVDAQGLGVDTVSGATITSKAILEAVGVAMKDAGADVEALKKVTSKVQEKEEDKEYTADVVVIGAGGAGLAAAVTANQEGASVIVIEKMPKVGGNTILAGGALNAVDEGSETAIANKDSVELHYTQTYEGGDKQGDQELVRTLVTNAWDGVEWLQSLGMEFKEGTFTVLGGMWPRAHKPVEPVGTGFFNAYQNYIDSNENIDLYLEVTAKEFIVEDGKVVGVIAEGKTGNKITLHANNGVVLATGGFGQNVEMRQEYNTLWANLDESIKSTNHAGATGDGIIMAEAVGAELVQMGNIQLLPMGDPETGSLSGNIEMGVENRIFVNDEGNRFVDEGARRDVMTTALFEQPNSHMWVILDSHDYPTGDEVNNFNESINQLVKDGRAFKGDTLEELAEQIGVDPANLVKAVEGFNTHVADKSADEFGRTLYQDPIDQGPYYAGARIPTVHHTMGGVKINTDAQVISTTGDIIPGLYAAGEVTGGIHGANRLGGNALTDTVVFGRIAGASAAQAK
ncbi:fumarate reductase flavoprotein subunit [Anaerorhabdus furcosa]|uniref:Urocanate reductase n=2 Tax=Anaerorhabdus furcosa TaxID=118967 RepID=A0A1T4NP08_9FIRM|nr:fumarate reductase flavoprotein subunit [Anaerorhabdus furcosa]